MVSKSSQFLRDPLSTISIPIFQLDAVNLRSAVFSCGLLRNKTSRYPILVRQAKRTNLVLLNATAISIILNVHGLP